MPGVQKPHWLAPVSQNASAQRSRTSSGRPSTVVIVRPATRRTGVTQATRGWPSTRTVQQPHCPCGLQPSLGERRPRSSRSTSSSDTPAVGYLDLPAVDLQLEHRAISRGHRSQDRFARMAHPHPLDLSRRRFLATAGGAAAGAVLLGACGGGDDDDEEETGGSTSTTATTSELVLAAYLERSLLRDRHHQPRRVRSGGLAGAAHLRRHARGARGLADRARRAPVGRTAHRRASRRGSAARLLPAAGAARRSRLLHGSSRARGLTGRPR